MTKKRTKTSEALIGAFIRKLRTKPDKHPGDAQTAYSIEDCTVAVVSALLSLRRDENPKVLVEDALELLNAAKDFLVDYAPIVNSADERERAANVTLNLKEAMRALGYTSYDGFWEAVDRTFDSKQALQLRTRKIFDLSTLTAIQGRSKAGKSLRAKKARDAKSQRRKGQ